MSVIVHAKRVSPVEMQDGRRRCWKIGPAEYKVFGRSADPYRIEVRNGVPFCPCDAGIRGRACWHAALVLARLQREAARQPQPSPARDEATAADVFAMLDPGDYRTAPKFRVVQ